MPSRSHVIGRCRYCRGMPVLDAASSALDARLVRGLSDPTRVAILLGLLESERRIANLFELVGVSQSNVSGHPACLEECGLQTDEPGERRQVFYRLSRPEVVDLLAATERLLASSGTATKRCGNPLMDGTCCDG